MASENGSIMLETSKTFDRTVLEGAPEPQDVLELGEGLKLTRRGTEELSVDFATNLLNMAEFSSDRPLDDRHVARLLNAMKRGTFLPEQVQIITCTLNGKEYRMNGQHTSWARLELNRLGLDDGYKC